MALSKKLVKAVKDAQKQAEATVAEVRNALDTRLSDVNVDPTPLYAVVGAADLAVETIRHAGEQLDAARHQKSGADLRKGARKEAADLQKELQKRIADLQARTAEMQKLATQLADKFIAQAQDLPAQVLNQGLVFASNAKDQYDTAAARGEKVVADLRTQGNRAAADVTKRSEDAVARGKKVVRTAAAEGEKIVRTAGDVVRDDTQTVTAQVERSAKAVDEAAAPEKPARPARKAVKKSATTKSAGKTTARKTTARKSAATGSATTKRAAKSTTKKSGS